LTYQFLTYQFLTYQFLTYQFFHNLVISYNILPFYSGFPGFGFLDLFTSSTFRLFFSGEGH